MQPQQPYGAQQQALPLPAPPYPQGTPPHHDTYQQEPLYLQYESNASAARPGASSSNSGGCCSLWRQPSAALASAPSSASPSPSPTQSQQHLTKQRRVAGATSAPGTKSRKRYVCQPLGVWVRDGAMTTQAPRPPAAAQPSHPSPALSGAATPATSAAAVAPAADAGLSPWGATAADAAIKRESGALDRPPSATGPAFAAAVVSTEPPQPPRSWRPQQPPPTAAPPLALPPLPAMPPPFHSLPPQPPPPPHGPPGGASYGPVRRQGSGDPFAGQGGSSSGGGRMRPYLAGSSEPLRCSGSGAASTMAEAGGAHQAPALGAFFQPQQHLIGWPAAAQPAPPPPPMQPQPALPRPVPQHAFCMPQPYPFGAVAAAAAPPPPLPPAGCSPTAWPAAQWPGAQQWAHAPLPGSGGGPPHTAAMSPVSWPAAQHPGPQQCAQATAAPAAAVLRPVAASACGALVPQGPPSWPPYRTASWPSATSHSHTVAADTGAPPPAAPAAWSVGGSEVWRELFGAAALGPRLTCAAGASMHPGPAPSHPWRSAEAEAHQVLDSATVRGWGGAAHPAAAASGGPGAASHGSVGSGQGLARLASDAPAQAQALMLPGPLHVPGTQPWAHQPDPPMWDATS